MVYQAITVTPEELQALEETLAGRGASYRMFSRLFLRPLDEADIDQLAAMKLEDRAVELDDAELLAAGFNDMGRGLHRRHTGTTRLLRTDYTMCFDGVAAWNEERAVPYASMFVGSKTGEAARLFQEPRKRDKAAYKREGVEVDAALNLPDDHLSFELSFMADLSDKMVGALRAGCYAEVRRLAQVSDEFRTQHILCWYGKLYDLALHIVETRFYQGLLKAAFGYLQLDGEVLAAVAAALEPPADDAAALSAQPAANGADTGASED